MKLRNLALIPALGAVFVLGACTAEKTEEGNMPEVDVQGGNLPEYDIDPAKVEISSDTQHIVTPDIDVEPQ